MEANALGRHTIFPRDESATLPKNAFTIAEPERLEGLNPGTIAAVTWYTDMAGTLATSAPTGFTAGASNVTGIASTVTISADSTAV